MKLSSAEALLKSELKHQFEAREISNFTRILWEDLFHIRGSIDRVLHTREIRAFQDAVDKLKKDYPVQYITNLSHFYGFKFYVDERVLIPRSETEELVHLVLQNYKSKGQIRILDIGTGSGCIAITLQKKLPDAIVHGWEKSAASLEVAKRNAELNDSNVKFRQIDFLSIPDDKDAEAFDIIISNPPYIADSEEKIMGKSTLLFEPRTALFPPGDDPLIFYKKISEFSKKRLDNGGEIFLECNEFNIREVKSLFLSQGYKNVEILEDLQGKERFIIASSF